MRIPFLLRLVPAVLAASALCSGQTQNFNVGSWFFGKNINNELPPGVVDLTDNMWASSTHTCPILITGSKAVPVAQIACRENREGARFLTVMQDGDPRLAGTRLALPTNASVDTGRYLTSMVRPGEKNLYFTSVQVGLPSVFSHQIAWRFRNYQVLERVVGAGDAVSMKLNTGQTVVAQISAAGPIDGTADGREFIYLESASANRYGIFEVKAGGVYDMLYPGRLTMRDTPWGMGGFVFAQGGLVFSNAGVTINRLDPDTGGVTILAQDGQPFLQTPTLPPATAPNLQLARMFSSTGDPGWFFMSWGINAGKDNPPQIVSWWKDWTWQPFYSNQPSTPNETIAGTFAVGERVTLLGGGPKGPGTSDYDVTSRITVPWAITSLWARGLSGVWTKALRDVDLPDSSISSPRKFYQGVTASKCQAEFATKRYDSSSDNSGPFFGIYRLYRPCIDFAQFNTVTRELVIRGVNFQDQRTEVGLPPPIGTPITSPVGQILPTRVTSVTSTEIHATVDSVPTLERIQVLVNGQVWSDPAPVSITSEPAPILADMTDINFDHTPAAPSKIMIVGNLFGCATAGATSVNYPTSLGTCSVILDNGIRLPMLFASNLQINFLMPATLAASPHEVRVTRTDATGIFTSGPFPFNSADNSPVAIKASNSNVIVTAIRNGQQVVLGPTDPIRPGEFFTIYVTGGSLASFPATARVGEVDAPMVAAVVNWAQGVVQVNVQAPPTALGSVLVTIGAIRPFPVRIN